MFIIAAFSEEHVAKLVHGVHVATKPFTCHKLTRFCLINACPALRPSNMSQAVYKIAKINRGQHVSLCLIRHF